MENVDNDVKIEIIADEERLFMSQVICEEVDLFYIDCYLREMFNKESL